MTVAYQQKHSCDANDVPGLRGERSGYIVLYGDVFADGPKASTSDLVVLGVLYTALLANSANVKRATLQNLGISNAINLLWLM